MITAAILTALLMGLTGSLHCAGMCGPIVMILPFRQMSNGARNLAIILYHSGRILVYTIMGVIIFSFKTVVNPSWQQHFSVFAGVVLLIVGFLSFTGGIKMNLPWTGFVQRQLSRLMSLRGRTTFFFAGALNGLLPCGLVYMALSVALNADTWIYAATQMVLFGLGTTPMLVAITVLGQKMAFFRRTSIQRLVPITLLFLSGLLMLRGMNLGIPYLSPEIAIEKEVIKSSCCNKSDMR